MRNRHKIPLIAISLLLLLCVCAVYMKGINTPAIAPPVNAENIEEETGFEEEIAEDAEEQTEPEPLPPEETQKPPPEETPKPPPEKTPEPVPEETPTPPPAETPVPTPEGTPDVMPTETPEDIPPMIMLAPQPGEATITLGAQGIEYGQPMDSGMLLNWPMTATGLPDGMALTYLQDYTLSVEADPRGLTDRSVGIYTVTFEPTAALLARLEGYTLTLTPGILTVSAKPATITIPAAAEKMYNGETYGFVTMTLPCTGLASDHTVYSAAVGNDSYINAGEYPGAVTARDIIIRDGSGQDVTANYTLSIVPQKLTINPQPITLTADDAIKDYKSTDPGFSAQITYGRLFYEDALDYRFERAGGEAPGTYAIGIVLGNNPNYAVTAVPGTLTIGEKPEITIALGNQTLPYGQAENIAAPLQWPKTMKGMPDGITLTYLLHYTVSIEEDRGGLANRGVGTYTVTFEPTEVLLDMLQDYMLALTPGELTVIQKPALCYPADAVKMYDGETYGFVAGTLTSADLVSGHTVYSAVVGNDSHSNAGEYPEAVTARDIIIHDEDDHDVTANYALDVPGGTLTITPKGNGNNPPGEGYPGQFYGTIEIDPQTKRYGEDDPALSFACSFEGLEYSDELSFAPVRVEGEDAGEYTVTVQWSDTYPTKNYDLTAVRVTEGSLTIEGVMALSADLGWDMNGMDFHFGTQELPSGPEHYPSMDLSHTMRIATDEDGSGWRITGEMGLFIGDDGSSFAGIITLSNPTKSADGLTVTDTITLMNGYNAPVVTAPDGLGSGNFNVSWAGANVVLYLDETAAASALDTAYHAQLTWILINGP